MGGMSDAGMTEGKKEAKIFLINKRLDSLLIDNNSNLKCIDEINVVLLGESVLCNEGKGEKKQTNGWLDNVIDILLSLSESCVEMQNKLTRLHREVIDK